MTTDGDRAAKRPVAPKTTLYIVRHGHRWDFANKAIWKTKSEDLGFSARDPPLSGLGHEQARCVAAAFGFDGAAGESADAAGIDAILSSPYLRAVQTAQPLAQGSGLPICIEEGLAETCHHFGTIDGAAKRFPYFPEVDLSYDPVYSSALAAGAAEAGPEPWPSGYLSRMLRLAELLPKRFRGRRVVCFTHAAAVALVARLAKQSLIEVGNFAPGGIFKLTSRDGMSWVLEKHGGDNSGHVRRNDPTTFPWGFLHATERDGSKVTSDTVKQWWCDALDRAAAQQEEPNTRANGTHNTTLHTILGFSSCRLSWTQEPTAWKVSADGGELEIWGDTGKDYWSKTYYDPPLVKADAPALLAEVPACCGATLELAFTLHPVMQFDQGGAMVLVDERTWIKAGIEYVDGKPRLSCVVTNDGFSDWSTQNIEELSLRVRIHKLLPGAVQGPAAVVEVVRPGHHEAWTFVRIASLRSGTKPWRMGPFAASPIEQKGGKAVFHAFQIGFPREVAHQSAAGHLDQ